MLHAKHTCHQRKRRWEIVPDFEGPHPPLITAVSTFVLNLSRHCDQEEERDFDGAVHWDSIHSKLLKEFGSRVGQKLLATKLASSNSRRKQQDEGSNTARIPKIVIHGCALQGHTGGNMISPELMGHVKIPTDWKEFVFHTGCSKDKRSFFGQASLLEKETKVEDRQFFFTPLNLFGQNSDEEAPGESLTSQYPVKYMSASPGNIIMTWCTG